jgi:hypothetical protein
MRQHLPSGAAHIEVSGSVTPPTPFGVHGSACKGGMHVDAMRERVMGVALGLARARVADRSPIVVFGLPNPD